MFDRFTDRARRVMALARKEAQRFNHEFIGTEHILLGLITEASGVAANVLKTLGVNTSEIRGEVEKNVRAEPAAAREGQLPFSPGSKKVLELSQEEANELGHNYIGTEHLLLALIRANDDLAAQTLKGLGVDLDEVRFEIMDLLGTQPPAERSRESSRQEIEAERRTPMLDAIGHDLNDSVRRGEHGLAVGSDEDVSRVLAVLGRRSRNNALLVSSSSVTGVLLLHAVAARIVSGDVPTRMEQRRIVLLEPTEAVMSLLRLGRSNRSIAGERRLLLECTREAGVILAFDDIPELVARVWDPESFSALVGSAIVRGSVQCAVVTTAEGACSLAEREPDLARRFERLVLTEATSEEALEMLTGVKQRYELYHHVRYGDDALRASVQLAPLYFPSEPFPERALDLLDDAGSRARLDHSVRPSEIKTMEERIEHLNEQKEKAVGNQDFQLAADVRNQADELKLERRRILESWRGERQADIVVGEPDIVAAVSRITGLGEESIARREPPETL